MSEPNHDSAAARTQCFALRGVRQYGAAADLFAGATARFPNDPALAFGLAQTRYELGYPAADLFARAQLAARPDWLAGHKALATLNWTSGDRAHFPIIWRRPAGHNLAMPRCGSLGSAIWRRPAIGRGRWRFWLKPSVILAQLRPFRSRACSSRSKAARQRLTS